MKKIIQLEEIIVIHNNLYYNENSPQISDYEYDLLKQELIKLKSEIESDLFEKDSIGSIPSNIFTKIEHKIPMLSLDNAFNNDDVYDFENKIKKFLNYSQNLLYTAELKIDGLSFAAIYINGKLQNVSTRGDGDFGEDITKNAMTIKNFPNEILSENIPNEIEVRGEIYLSNKDFEILKNKQIENEQKPFANARNAASGSLRLLDENITRSRNLSYFAYNIANIDKSFNIKTQSECLDLLKKLGFSTSDFTCKSSSIEECLKFYSEIEKHRYDIDFDIDGIVYKLDDLGLQKRLGNTNKSPRWAIAHKFAGNYAISKINNIIHQVGRLGNITPVAELEPINVGGVVVKKATLHNYDEIFRLQIGIGDIVKITRAGDVVPRIVEIIERKSNMIMQAPQNCPSCKDILLKDDDLVALKCNNAINCKEQIIQKLIHFASKDALNIDGFGKKQIERFYNLKIITNISDIYNISNKKEEIENLDRMGDKSIFNLLNSIENSKNTTLNKLFYSLSIKHIGYAVAEILAKYFSSIENFILQTKNIDEMYVNLANLNGMGYKIAIEFCNYFKNENNMSIFHSLIKQLNINEYVLKGQHGKFFGMKIVFTGTLESMTRQEAKNIAQTNGFEILSSVSKNINFVIAGANSGSKLKTANILGIKVLNEEEWMQMIKNV